MKIEPGKFYKTRVGSKAQIYAVHEVQDRPVHGAILHPSNQWRVHTWLDNGRVFFDDACGDDIISEWNEWEDFKIDDPVMVSMDGNIWHKRYFAGLFEQRPTAWNDGSTSWTGYEWATWNYCRKPTPEEMS